MLGLALVVAMAGVGCGDDDDTVPTDAGTDSGTDSGMRDTGMPDEDAGTDAGPPSVAFFVRVAHLIPGGPAVRVCAETLIGEDPSGTLAGPLPPPADPAIPFRGVSPYVTFQLPPGVDGYRVYVLPAEIDGSPLTSCDAERALLVEDFTEVEIGGYYTVAAVGFAGEPATWPEVCRDPGTGEVGPCPEALRARLVLFEDDSEIDAAATKIRVAHAVPNVPALQVCYDPDGSEGEMEPVELFDGLAFGTATEFHTSAMAITGGSIRLFPSAPAAPDCTALEVRPEIAELIIPTTFMAIKTGIQTAAGRTIPEIVTAFELGRVTTVFAQGIGGLPETDPLTVLFVPWQDFPAIPAD